MKNGGKNSCAVAANKMVKSPRVKKVLTELGYKTVPLFNEKRADIVQLIYFNNELYLSYINNLLYYALINM